MKDLFFKSKKKGAISVVLFLVLEIGAMYSWKNGGMTLKELIFSTVLSLLISGIFLINYKFNKWVSIGWFAIFPLCSFLLLESITHNPFNMDIKIIFLNILFYYLFFFALLFATGSGKWAGIIGLLLILLIGSINYFVLYFRSIPIVPWDIWSIKIAASVANQYQFVFSFRYFLVLLGFMYLFFVALKSDFKIKKVSVKISISVVSLILMIVYFNYIKTDAAKNSFHLNDTLFTPTHMYNTNGFLASFMMNFRYLDIDIPEGYSLDELKTYEEINEAKNTEQINLQEKPNIIVIMNEAFSDIAVNGEFNTTEDYMPFIRSMKENTMKGSTYVSVKGGNTANSEFEFLTNSSLAFLPIGSVAYQQYIFQNTPNLTSQLSSYGYRTEAVHPFGAGGWKRNSIYQYFGFDNMHFIDEFEDGEYIRDYISDWSTYEKIIDLYNNKDTKDRLFIFDVTMQNHGSYTKEFDNFSNSILLDVEEDLLYRSYTEQYLSLIKESDRAFEHLIEYFEKVDDDTIILMFGDHQPADYISEPIYEMNGIDDKNLSLEEEQNHYIVPYILWTNYDIEEDEIDEISLNYLNTILLDKANLPRTSYQMYLENLRKTLPVVTGNIYKDSNGTMYPRGDNTYGDYLSEYQKLQYNLLFDTNNRLKCFYEDKKE